jgi:hypothetical protein
MASPIRSQNWANTVFFTFETLNKSLGLCEAIWIKAVREPKHINPEARIRGADKIDQTVRSDCEIPYWLHISKASIFDAKSHGARNCEISPRLKNSPNEGREQTVQCN